jgi:hypothetical protein
MSSGLDGPLALGKASQMSSLSSTYWALPIATQQGSTLETHLPRLYLSSHLQEELGLEVGSLDINIVFVACVSAISDARLYRAGSLSMLRVKFRLPHASIRVGHPSRSRISPSRSHAMIFCKHSVSELERALSSGTSITLHS